MTIWIGVDPGRSHTGLVARDGRDLITFEIIDRCGDEWLGHGVGAKYIWEVLGAIQAIRDDHPDSHIAVEGVNEPKGFKDGKRQFAMPADLIGVAIVLGAIQAAHPNVTVVPPGGNGSGMLATYPAELIGHQERARGLMRPAGQNSQLRHARSGWDVSLRGEQIARGRVA